MAGLSPNWYRFLLFQKSANSMDANGARFHLMLGQDDWAQCRDAHGRLLASLWATSTPDGDAETLYWDPERDEITLQPRLFQFVAAPRDRPPALADRRGAGRDRFGNWYWIDDSCRAIRVSSAGTSLSSHFWSTADDITCEPAPRSGDFQPREIRPSPTPAQLSGLAVTEDHYLVVGTLEPAGLLLFDLHAGGPPQQLLWPETVAFTPFDMAPRPGGGVWILDRDHLCYWGLDRYFRVIPQEQGELTVQPEQLDDFQPVDPGITRRMPPRIFPAGISLGAASPLLAYDPIAIEALPDGTVLILDHQPGAAFSDIYRYRFSQLLGEPVSTRTILDVVEEAIRSDFRLSGHDFAFVPEHTGADGKFLDRVYVVGADGNQTFAFHLTLHDGQLVLEALTHFYPMRLFGGKGLVAAGGEVYYDFADRWIPLVAQHRPRYVVEATLETPLQEPRQAFDSGEPGSVWHRLMLDACLPPDTEVRVWSRAADDEGRLALTAWRAEPPLYRRGDGAELPYMQHIDGVTYDTWELLLQEARGRYLQLRLRLTGNGRSTPHLRALRIYYPRFSYLERYLPAVYREEQQAASFLDRWLANLEGLYTAIEDKIAAVQMLFDVRSAPAETLEWLASWFGVALDPAWDETRRRLFIAHAVEFFQYRGTIRGLQMALRLALDACVDATLFSDGATLPRQSSAIRIVEKFRTRRTPGVVFGDPTELAGPQLAQQTERWLPSQGGTELHRRYTEFRQPSGLTPGQLIEFPIKRPADPIEAAAWQQFALATLGFLPSAISADATRWQDFLMRRYRRIEALNTAYQLRDQQRLTAFTQSHLPDRIPPDGAPVKDWYQFESVVLAMQRTAHLFTVLLPVPRLQASQPSLSPQRLELARRIAELEKPAHTVFDLKFYWAMFRIGEVRLGEDTLLDRGSRAPELMPSMVLGQGYLAESFLAPRHPQDVADRYILGREPLRRGALWREETAR
ncbi:MAG TPA: phage tail protein [Candidatus Tectomicrobia bacterium]|nr:phage tail protein [Candidatus Tectomicrobia bacterium]